MADVKRWVVSIKLAEKEFLPGGSPRPPRETVLSDFPIYTRQDTEEEMTKRYEEIVANLQDFVTEKQRRREF